MWMAQQRAADPASHLRRRPPASPRRPFTYRCGVCTAGPKRQRRWVEGAQLACHLLHPTQRALPVRVRQLDYEAG